jgi:hypothetical protein
VMAAWGLAGVSNDWDSADIVCANAGTALAKESSAATLVSFENCRRANQARMIYPLCERASSQRAGDILQHLMPGVCVALSLA